MKGERHGKRKRQYRDRGAAAEAAQPCAAARIARKADQGLALGQPQEVRQPALPVRRGGSPRVAGVHLQEEGRCKRHGACARTSRKRGKEGAPGLCRTERAGRRAFGGEPGDIQGESETEEATKKLKTNREIGGSGKCGLRHACPHLRGRDCGEVLAENDRLKAENAGLRDVFETATEAFEDKEARIRELEDE